MWAAIAIVLVAVSSPGPFMDVDRPLTSLCVLKGISPLRSGEKSGVGRRQVCGKEFVLDCVLHYTYWCA